MAHKKEKEKVKISTIIYAFLALAVFYIIAVGAALYYFGMSNPILERTAKIIPYPVTIINNTSFVSSKELSEKLDLAKAYYEKEDFSKIGKRIDFSTPEGKKRFEVKQKQLLNKMIENKIIEILARKAGIKITPEMAAQEVERKIDQYGDAKKIQEKLDKYGWTQSDFEKNIVIPSMYQEKLTANFLQTDESLPKALEKIKNAQTDLNNKKDFSETAKTFSEGESAGDGGYVGWFSKNQMLPEISSAAFSMKKGGLSDILQSSLGYHIIKIENRRTMNGEDQVEIRQIFVRTKSFADWLLEQEKSMKVYIPFKGLYWDKENGEIAFSNIELEKLEETMLQEDYGDASF